MKIEGEKEPRILSDREISLVRKFEAKMAIELLYFPSTSLIVGALDNRHVVNAKIHGKGYQDVKEALERLRRYNLSRISRIKLTDQEGRCARCSRVRPLHLHHKKHRSAGGDDDPENLELICAEYCHKDEHRVA
jgi:hypothetical protein